MSRALIRDRLFTSGSRLPSACLAAPRGAAQRRSMSRFARRCWTVARSRKSSSSVTHGHAPVEERPPIPLAGGGERAERLRQRHELRTPMGGRMFESLA